MNSLTATAISLPAAVESCDVFAVMQGFSRDAVLGYLPDVVQLAASFLATWSRQESVPLLGELKCLTFDISCSLIMGFDVGVRHAIEPLPCELSLPYMTRTCCRTLCIGASVAHLCIQSFCHLIVSVSGFQDVGAASIHVSECCPSRESLSLRGCRPDAWLSRMYDETNDRGVLIGNLWHTHDTIPWNRILN